MELTTQPIFEKNPMINNTQLEYTKGGNKMLAQQNRYIFPPRIRECIPPEDMDFYGTIGYHAQIKYNDTRTLIKLLPNDEIQLWSRHGERLKTYTLPDWIEPELQNLRTKLNINPDQWSLIDGGLLDCKHKAIKDTFVIWDILVLNSTHLLNTTYQERYDLLYATCSTKETYKFTNSTGTYTLGDQVSEHVIIPHNLTPDKWKETWETIQKINKPYDQPLIEGLVFKQLTGKLTHGQNLNNNTDWQAKTRVQTKRHRF